MQRELDQRTSDGLTVTLLYDPTTPEHLTVTIADVKEPDLPTVLTVHRDRALDAFRHPFAYATA